MDARDNVHALFAYPNAFPLPPHLQLLYVRVLHLDDCANACFL